MKEIKVKEQEVMSIFAANQQIDVDIDIIKVNEQSFLKHQMEEYEHE